MSDELDDILEAGAEREDLDDTAQKLAHARPLPAPAFRGALARLLRAVPIPAPVRHLSTKALALAIGGALLLAVAGAGVAGSGPLAPGGTTQGASKPAISSGGR